MTSTPIIAAAGPDDIVAWRDPETLVLGLEGKTPAQVNHFLVMHGIEVQHLALERASLESVFLSLTNGHADVSREDGEADPAEASQEMEVRYAS